MATAAVFGCTGVVGAQILATTLSTELFSTVHTISRRAPKSTGSKLKAVIEADTAAWGPKLEALSPAPNTVFSAVGTTRRAAGGIQKQWKIDHDLNVDMVKAAKKAGASTFVFISSIGVRGFVGSRLPYGKMKIGVEDAIKDLDFEHAVILRPGMILSDRENEQDHPGAQPIKALIRGVGKVVGEGLMDSWGGQDGEMIARAAVAAAKLVSEGKAPSKFWVLEVNDIVRLGKKEWKDCGI